MFKVSPQNWLLTSWKNIQFDYHNCTLYFHHVPDSDTSRTLLVLNKSFIILISAQQMSSNAFFSLLALMPSGSGISPSSAFISSVSTWWTQASYPTYHKDPLTKPTLHNCDMLLAMNLIFHIFIKDSVDYHFGWGIKPTTLFAKPLDILCHYLKMRIDFSHVLKNVCRTLVSDIHFRHLRNGIDRIHFDWDC